MSIITVVQLPIPTLSVSSLDSSSVNISTISTTYWVTDNVQSQVALNNTIFTTSIPYKASTISVYVNGIKEHNFIQLTDQSIQFSSAPKTVGFTDYVEITYQSKQ